VRRPCLTCGRPCEGSYCRVHRIAKPREARGYGQAWRKKRDGIIRAWIALHGLQCPGTRYCTVPGIAHPVALHDLTVDHDYGEVMCRSANSRKGGGDDRMSNKPKGGNRIVRF
jgi:hypothetical protein